MPDNLEHYQDALVDLLSSDKDPKVIIDCIKKDPALRKWVPDIDLWRPDMVKRAQQLVSRWGRVT